MTDRQPLFDENPDPREQEVVARGLEILADGPLTMLELLRHLEQDTPVWDLADDWDTTAFEVIDDLTMHYEGFWTLPDDRIAAVDWILEGVVLTHRVTVEELESGTVDYGIDFTPLDIGREGIPLGDGSGTVSTEFGESPTSPLVLTGPNGWLDGFEPDDVLALRLEEGELWVERADDVGSGEEEAAALREEVFARRHEPDAGVDLFPVVFDLLGTRPELFRSPTPPLSELVSKAGLNLQGDYVGPDDEKWEPPYVIADRRFRKRLARQWNLDPCCEEALDTVIEAWRSFWLHSEQPDRETAEALAHGSVAHAFLDRATNFPRSGGTLLPQHAQFATALVEVGGPRAAGAFLLRALIADHEGRVLEAEADLERAVTMDRGYPPALATLADYAAERGDPRRALSLLRRAGAPADHPTCQFLEDLLPDTSGVGRNDPCPCGSGRKFKVCCQQHPRIPPADRKSWLVNKIVSWVAQRHTPRLHGLAASAVHHADFEIEDMASMAQDRFILELATFEEGLIEDYLEARGPLLPIEDRELVTAWTESRYQLWQVTGVGDHHLEIRDTASGEVLEMVETGSSEIREGDYLLGRVGPGYDRVRFLGEVLTIDLRHRDRLLWLIDTGPDPDLLARWYGELHLPPTFTNREGHALVPRRAWLKPLGDPEELEEALDERYERTDAGWQSTIDLDGEKLIRATLRWDGDTLSVNTNSEERLASILVELPGVRVVDEDWPEPGDSEPGGGMLDLDDLDPEIRRELEAHVEAMEDRWLDESIPALDGITPRVAADDPTRRGDLELLLRQFDRMRIPGAMGYDPDRIRRKLGLNEER